MINAAELEQLAESSSLKLVGTQSLVIDSPASSEPVTLEQAKAHLRQPLPDDDDYISGLITAARQMAEGRLNRTLVQRELTARFASCDGRFYLNKPPIVSVESVTYLDAEGVEQTVAPAGYRLQTSNELPRLFATLGAEWPSLLPTGGEFQVEYIAGYAPGEVPQPIVQWMLLVIGALYAHRESMTAGVKVEMIPEEFNRWLLQPYMVYE